MGARRKGEFRNCTIVSFASRHWSVLFHILYLALDSLCFASFTSAGRSLSPSSSQLLCLLYSCFLASVHQSCQVDFFLFLTPQAQPTRRVWCHASARNFEEWMLQSRVFLYSEQKCDALKANVKITELSFYWSNINFFLII